MQNTLSFLLLLTFFSFVHFGCERLDPIFNELEGSYSGTILIDEVYRSYDEGVVQQDTLVQEILVNEALEFSIVGDAFESCGEFGVIRIMGDSLQFFIESKASNNQGCGSFFSAFPQYAYQFIISADSLKVDLHEEGVTDLFGSHNRQYIRINRQLRLKRN